MAAIGASDATPISHELLVPRTFLAQATFGAIQLPKGELVLRLSATASTDWYSASRALLE